MMRKLFTVPGVVADFTVGTVIVLTQMLLVERDTQRRLKLAGR
jgi:hypothetical protein